MTKSKSKSGKARSAAKHPVSRSRRTRPRVGAIQMDWPIAATASAIAGSDSSLRVRAEELAYIVKNETKPNGSVEFPTFQQLNSSNTFDFWPGASGMTRLDQYGRMFEQYRLIRAVVKYRTGSGTVISGRQLTGIDYEPSDVPASVAELQIRQPRVRTPVWQNAELPVDVKRANKSHWMFTAGGAAGRTELGFTSAFWVGTSAPIAATDTEYGDVWIDYEVEFTSPTTTDTSPVVSMWPLEGSWQSNTGAWEQGSKHATRTVKVEGTGTPNLNVTPTMPGVYNGTISFWNPETTVDTAKKAITDAFSGDGRTVEIVQAFDDAGGRSVVSFVVDVLPAAVNKAIKLAATAVAYQVINLSYSTVHRRLRAFGEL